MQVLAQAYAKNQPDAKITVLSSTGSSGGIKAVLAGAIQIGVSSRPPSGVESKGGAVAVEYGRTPFVLATAAASKVTGITTQNLVDSRGTRRFTSGCGRHGVDALGLVDGAAGVGHGLPPSATRVPEGHATQVPGRCGR